MAHNESNLRRAGAVPEIMCLITQGEMALYLGNEALKTFGQPALPTGNGWAPIVIPPILVLTEQMLPAGYTKAAVGFLKSKLGMMLRASVIVSQMAVAYFTGSAVVIAVLSYLAIDELDCRKLLPTRISWLYQSIHLPLTLILAVLAKGTWAGAALFLAITVANYAIPKLIPSDPKGNTGQLTPAILKDILDKQNPFQDFEINLAHMAWNSMPMQPEVQLSELLDLWDQIPWEKYPSDPRIAPPANPRGQLEKLIQALQKQPFPMDLYEAKIVIDYLKHDPTEAERAKILSKLSSSSEHGFYFLFTELSARIVAQGKPVSLRTGILRRLQGIRMAQLQPETGLIASFREARFPINVGALYGLVRHQHEIFHPTLPVWLMWKYLGDLIREDLRMNYYEPKSISRSIEFQYQNSPLVRSWWHGFIRRQSPENQTAFRRLLASEQRPRMSRVEWEHQLENRAEMMRHPRNLRFLESQPALPTSNLEGLDLAHVEAHRKKTHISSRDTEDIQITQKVILAMLFEMGILQRKAKLAPQAPEQAGYVEPLSELLQVRVEKQNLLALKRVVHRKTEELQQIALKIRGSSEAALPQPTTATAATPSLPPLQPRVVAAPSVSINLPRHSLSLDSRRCLRCHSAPWVECRTKRP